MTAQSRDRRPARAPFLTPPGKSLRSIRAALSPADLGDFDREYRAVMTEAIETLDLDPVGAFIERWWRVAWSSAGSDDHHAMLDTAQRLLNGEDVRTRPLREVLAERGF
ncbi:DUF6247 family protein [Thermostaphylospora chromogena]|uniref:Uncharacterized protein n=1 Tax=Thermostaphylospora chromogena TaxID=35622 RepID=A0A1H1HZT4_9ACTN|nr:DUF6247 family protein [Thermostaphylospora chromogena]SDR30618.1 hypothetical protein SAMN04489764_4979 [Thermostaphylospora chromogena]